MPAIKNKCNRYIRKEGSKGNVVNYGRGADMLGKIRLQHSVIPPIETACKLVIHRKIFSHQIYSDLINDQI